MTKHEFLQRLALALVGAGHTDPNDIWAIAQDIASAQPKSESKPRATKSFIKPTLEELKGYFAEQKIVGFTPQDFINHYDSKGWLIGKTPMKNWKAAVATWVKRYKEKQQENKPKSYRLEARR